ANSGASPLTIGSTVTSNIGQIGETDQYSFTLASAANLYFDSLTFDQSIHWSLQGPVGEIVSLASFAFSDWFYEPLDSLRLPAGSYQLTVDADYDYVGEYAFRILNSATATAITPGTARTSTLSPASETEVYRFTATAGSQFYFDVLDATDMPNATWRLVDPNGYQWFNTGLTDVDTLSLPVAGTYTLYIEGYSGDAGAGSYSFNVRPVVASATTTLELASQIGKHFEYDSTFSQLTKQVDELGRVTLIDVDPTNGNARSVTRIVGDIGGDDDLVTRYTYTSRGFIDLETDPLGRITDYDYDAQDRLIRTTVAKGTVDEAIRRFVYADATGLVTASIDENGNQTDYQYDAANRLIRITEPDPDGAGPLASPVTRFEYDARGNLTATTDSRGNVTRSVYDPLDRVIASMDAKGQVTSLEYDRNGNVTAVADPLGHRTQQLYDSRNRIVTSIAADGGETTYRYDEVDRLVSLTDPVNNTTLFVYDARNRLVTETDPLGNSMNYSYDFVDNLVSKTDRNERTTTYTYDSLDRLAEETWAGTSTVISFQYDKASNLTSVQDPSSRLTFTYDSRDRVKTVDNNGTPGAPRVVLTYAYDKVGNVISLVDTINGNSGATNAYVYDTLNRMTRLTQTGANVANKRVDLGYNQLGQFASIKRFSDVNGANRVVDSNYTYDSLNRLTSLTHHNGIRDIAFYNLAFDAADRISSITDIDGINTYTYDDTDQLIQADYSNAARSDETYAYDANGNRTSSNAHGNGYVTGPGNRLLSDGTYQYAYDDVGNLIKRTETATGRYREFEWDFRNRLTAVTDKNSANVATQKVTFTYDALDRRISKGVDVAPQDAVDAVVTRFVYDRDNVLLDFVDSDGSEPAANVLAKRYLHGPADDQVLAQDSGGSNVQWMLGDQLGTVRDLVSNTGVVVNHLVYDSFGNVTSQTNGNVSSRYGFTGRELDWEMDLYFFRSR
ncbi:MAG: hypothetical protein KDA87_23735, partial [Planctomycetales bacterium]|nr:hypothetical protein [Planctomycetales bacterium]